MAIVVGAAAAHPGAGIIVDSKGQVYFVHGIRHRIWRIDAVGKLTTFAQGEDGKLLSVPHHLVIDKDDNLYSVGDRDNRVVRISPAGKIEAIYLKANERGHTVGSGGDPFTRDAAGDIYSVNYDVPRFSRVNKIDADGKLTLLAGGGWGFADGRGDRAKFGALHGSAFAWASDGRLLMTDNGTSVRSIAADGTVKTIAGAGEPGFADGPAAQARFRGAVGLTVDARGTILVADGGNRRIRAIAAEGAVSTIAGSGKSGGADGPALQATFADPSGVAVTRDGTIYVLDFVGDNPRVRKIINNMVTTIARTE
jgi:DNA-binding beta-propeller fold protein YncE